MKYKVSKVVTTKIENVKDLLEGTTKTITLPEISKIRDFCFYGSSYIKTLNIPNSVKYIGRTIFSSYIPPAEDTTITINYFGTINEWDNIIKDENWNQYQIGNLKIKCTDGEINI